MYLPTRATRLTVGHDTAARQFTELLKLTLEPLLVDVPREVTNEEVGGSTLRSIGSLRFLGRNGRLLNGLALLGCLGGILAVFILRLGAVRVIRVGVRVGVRRGLRELVEATRCQERLDVPFQPSWP